MPSAQIPSLWEPVSAPSSPYCCRSQSFWSHGRSTLAQIVLVSQDYRLAELTWHPLWQLASFGLAWLGFLTGISLLETTPGEQEPVERPLPASRGGLVLRDSGVLRKPKKTRPGQLTGGEVTEGLLQGLTSRGSRRGWRTLEPEEKGEGACVQRENSSPQLPSQHG
jgi:hypothetical protein